MSLRTQFVVAACILCGLALLAGAGGGGLGVAVGRATHDLELSAESVRESLRLTSDLFQVNRARNVDYLTGVPTSRAARDAAEAQLRHDVRAAGGYVASADEGQLLARAASEVEHYLAARDAAEGARLPLADVIERATPELDAAAAALEQFAQYNIAESEHDKHDLDLWLRAAGVTLSTIAVLLLAVAASLVWIGYRGAMEPLLALSQSLRGFGTDSAGGRLPEAGPLEVRALARAFNDMADRLERQREEQLAFVGFVAHELRTPLSALKLASEVVSSERADVTRERREKAWQLMARQMDQLDRLVRDFLDLSRIEAGRFELELAGHELGDLVGRVVELHRSTGRDHPVQVLPADEPLWVEADGRRLEQVVGNLLSNAMKYSPIGTPVRVSLRAESGRAVLAIADEGVGVAAADHRRIFEPFERTRAASAMAPGVGLGLALVRQLVRAHGGEVTVESAPGGGATFTVLLPLVSGVAREPRRERQAASGEGERLSV